MDDTGANEWQTLHEIVAAAHATLDRNMWDYLIGGTETETTVARNRLALDRIGFRPRVCVDVSAIDTGVEFLGHRVAMPVLLAPVGGLDTMAPGGGVTVAQGAGLAGVPFCLSSVTERRLEDVAAAASGPRVFQLYVRGDAAWVDDHVHRAMAAGYDAFCITVDSAIYSRRERDIANRFAKPWRANPSASFQAAVSWADLERFRAAHPAVRLWLKGIAVAEDAVRACDLGVGRGVGVEPWRTAAGSWRGLDGGAAGDRGGGGGAGAHRGGWRHQPRQRRGEGDRLRGRCGGDRAAVLLRAGGRRRGGGSSG